MCFSAQASFVASGVLSIVGVIAVAKAKNNSIRLLATVPLLFALQQFFEGLVWLSFAKRSTLHAYQLYFVYGFLLFAFVLWPLWIPYSIMSVESSLKRKRYLAHVLLAGVITAGALLAALFFLDVSVLRYKGHLVYQLNDMPYILTIVGAIAYLVATVMPFFLSSMRFMSFIGMLMALSYAYSYYFYPTSLVSIWCFFAAFISILVLIVVWYPETNPYLYKNNNQQ